MTIFYIQKKWLKVCGQNFTIMTITPVYVGDLPAKTKDGHAIAELDEEFLRNLFAEYGKIVEGDQGIRIITREDRNGNPYCYAFINFQTRQDADNAIRELNYTKLDGCPIRLGIADKETKRIRQSGQGNLFIKNLDKDIEVSQLHDAFGNFGEIISCKIPTDEHGKSRGYGYVQFRKSDDAEQAMADLKEASINGRPITIEHFQKRQRQNPEETFTNVYIKNLPPSIKNDQDLRNLFSKYGEIESCYLQVDENNVSRGVGFCAMKSHEEAAQAVKELNGMDLDGYNLTCNRSMSRAERLRYLRDQTAKFRRATFKQYQGRNLYIKNIDENVTEENLRPIFEKYGPIESIKIMKDENGVSKKFGYVCFAREEDARTCISESPLLKFNDKQLYVATHKARDDRIREQTILHSQRMLNAQQQNAQDQMNNNFAFQPPMPGFQINIQGLPPPVEFNSTDPRAKLRQIINDEKGLQASIYLTRLRDMSDIQAQDLSNSPELLHKWLEIP